MPKWQGSTRRDRLPDNWPQLRKDAGRRDSWLCQAKKPNGRLCLMPANQVDHVVPGDDHRLSNLQCLCEDHHSTKSGQEGAAAMWRQRRKIDQKFRRTEEHPGLL